MDTYLQNGLKVERKSIPESEFSTGGSGYESPSFRSPLSERAKIYEIKNISQIVFSLPYVADYFPWL